MSLGLLDHVVPHLEVCSRVIKCLSRYTPIGTVSNPLLVKDPAGTDVAFESGCSRIEQVGYVVGESEFLLLNALLRAAVTYSRQARLNVCSAALAVSEFHVDDSQTKSFEQSSLYQERSRRYRSNRPAGSSLLMSACSVVCIWN